MKILVNKKFQGQIRRYGDYLYGYFIEADCSEEDVLNFVKFVLNKKTSPRRKGMACKHLH